MVENLSQKLSGRIILIMIIVTLSCFAFIALGINPFIGTIGYADFFFTPNNSRVFGIILISIAAVLTLFFYLFTKRLNPEEQARSKKLSSKEDTTMKKAIWVGTIIAFGIILLVAIILRNANIAYINLKILLTLMFFLIAVMFLVQRRFKK